MVKASVIMGVYNIDEYLILEKSIMSVLNQTFKEFEFIICADGSNSKTFEYLRQFAAKDSRIILLKNEENMGLAATLNRCLTIAKGEYIIRQDADDYSNEYRFEKQISFLDQNREYGFVGSCIQYFDNTCEWGEYKLKEYPEKRDFLFTVPIMHGSVIFRRKSLEAVKGYRVAKETRRAEDYDLFMRMYAVGMTAVNLQEKFYFVREDKSAYSRRKYIYRIDDVIVRYKGFKQLGILWEGAPYLLKPLIVGLMPRVLLNKLKDIYYSRR